MRAVDFKRSPTWTGVDVATFVTHKVSFPSLSWQQGMLNGSMLMLADSTRMSINLTAVNERVNVSTYA
jgi:hypothetical protein